MANSNKSNMNALFEEIMQAMSECMNEVESLTYLDTLNNMSDAYANKNENKQYQNTYQMLNSPRTTNVMKVGNTVSATIYLDQSYNYNTGTYSTPKVFDEAEKGGSGIKLKSGFWDKTLNNIPRNMQKSFSKRFK